MEIIREMEEARWNVLGNKARWDLIDYSRCLFPNPTAKRIFVGRSSG